MNYIALLRGAPLTVLWALLQEGGLSTTAKLGRITGYSQPTITKACKMLCDAGIAVDGLMGWSMLGQGLQMILGEDGKGKNFLPTTTVNYIDKNQIPLNLKAEEGKNFLLLRAAGVGEPMLTRLASELDEDYVSAHVAKWRKDKLPPNVLVHRLRNKDLAPVDPENRDHFFDGKYSEIIER
jgi:hypothetical protein